MSRDPSAPSGSDSLPGDNQQNRGEEARLAQQLEEVRVQVTSFGNKVVGSNSAIAIYDVELFYQGAARNPPTSL